VWCAAESAPGFGACNAREVALQRAPPIFPGASDHRSRVVQRVAIRSANEPKEALVALLHLRTAVALGLIAAAASAHDASAMPLAPDRTCLPTDFNSGVQPFAGTNLSAGRRTWTVQVYGRALDRCQHGALNATVSINRVNVGLAGGRIDMGFSYRIDRGPWTTRSLVRRPVATGPYPAFDTYVYGTDNNIGMGARQRITDVQIITRPRFPNGSVMGGRLTCDLVYRTCVRAAV
jgi:hypothetical protein